MNISEKIYKSPCQTHTVFVVRNDLFVFILQPKYKFSSRINDWDRWTKDSYNLRQNIWCKLHFDKWIKLRCQYRRYWTLGRRPHASRHVALNLHNFGVVYWYICTFPKNVQLPWNASIVCLQLYQREACGRRPNVQYLRYWHLNLIHILKCT